MKIYLIFSLLLSFHSAFAESWGRKLYGHIGGISQCEKNYQEDYHQLNCGLKNKQGFAPLPLVEHKNFEQVSENIIWQALASRSHQHSICQKLNLKPFFTDLNKQQTIINLAIKAFESKREELQDWIQKRKLYNKKAKNIETSLKNKERMAIKFGRNEYFEVRDTMTRAIFENRKLAELYNLRIEQTIAGFPFGRRSKVAQFYEKIAKKNSYQPQKFHNQFIKATLKSFKHLDKSINHFEKKRDANSFYQLSGNDKEAFVRSGMTANIITESEQEDNLTGLSCRLRAKYVKGPASVDVMGTIALTGISVVPGLGQAALVARAASLAVKMASVGVKASTAAMSFNQIKSGCFNPKRELSAQTVTDAKGQCLSQDLVSGVQEEMRIGKCVSGVLLATTIAPTIVKLADKTRKGHFLTAGAVHRTNPAALSTTTATTGWKSNIHYTKEAHARIAKSREKVNRLQYNIRPGSPATDHNLLTQAYREYANIALIYDTTKLVEVMGILGIGAYATSAVREAIDNKKQEKNAKEVLSPQQQKTLIGKYLIQNNIMIVRVDETSKKLIVVYEDESIKTFSLK